uniref:Phospholipase A2 domain-containing protein n=1 Tax=Strongyloides venezuelensis TaxID=75913 RepID=A0A0K0FM97_STRVS
MTFNVENQVKRSLNNLRVIPHLDKFYCGTDGLVSFLAENKISHSCPKRYNQANMCCYEHDNCYSEQLGQEYCDDVFCSCLSQYVGGDGEDSKCVSVANYFCETVKDFGSYAYSASATSNSSVEDSGDKSETQTNDHETTSNTTNDELITTIAPVATSTILFHFNECNDEKEIIVEYCISKFDECKENDKEDKELCNANFCDCISNRITNNEIKYLQLTCMQELINYCPVLLTFSSSNLDRDSFNLKDTLWNLFLAYSNFIYLGLIIVFICIYLYVKGYLHTYPLKYEQAPSELSQVGILSDLTINMTDVTLLTPTKLRPSSSASLEFENKLQEN